MVVYNLTNMTNANNIQEMFVAMNSLTGGVFAMLILFMSYIIIFIVFKNFDTRTVLLVDSFIISILSIIFLWSGLVGTIPVMICFSVLVLTIILELFWR